MIIKPNQLESTQARSVKYYEDEEVYNDLDEVKCMECGETRYYRDCSVLPAIIKGEKSEFLCMWCGRDYERLAKKD